MKKKNEFYPFSIDPFSEVYHSKGKDFPFTEGAWCTGNRKQEVKKLSPLRLLFRLALSNKKVELELVSSVSV